LYLLVAAGVIASWLNRDTLLVRYRLWKQERALSQAREFIDRHDAANAELALRVAIVAVPGNLPTLRAAADMLEQVASPQAMRLRRTVVQLAPDSAEDQAAFVLCCIKFNDLNAARDAMSGIPPKTAATPVALNAALAYALTTGDRPMADVIFQQLEKFYPKSGLLQFDHNRLRLKLPKGPAQQAAQRELTDLAQADPKLAPQIYREFAADAIQRGDYAFAKHWLAMVLADPSATVTDRIQEANIELVIDRKPFESVYPPLAALAAQKPDEITSFVRWLIVQNRADEAVKLLGGLPAAVRDRPDIKRSEADCLAQMKDWDGLLPMVERGAWGPVSVTAVKLAEAAKTIDLSGRSALRHDTWDLVLDAANGDLSTLRVVEHLAVLWNWGDEAQRSLWSIVRAFPDQTWAAQALFDQYRLKKDAAGMRDIMGTLRDADGAVSRYTNDWAILTLLTEPTSDWNPAKEAMHSLYIGAPGNPTYATGYAFALAQSGKGPEALAIVGKFAPMDRDYPERQPYLAFIYGVARQPADLARAETIAGGRDYLPEEVYLFTRAHEELTRRPAAKAGQGPKPS
jgi:hypothetical protein